MKIAPSSAASSRSGWSTCWNPASEVPTSTGAMAAGSVRSRAAISQIRTPLISAPRWSLRPAGEAVEVGRPLLQERVAALLRLLAHVEEVVGVVGELLEPGHPVLVGVEARLHHPQRERREREHLTAPADGLGLELGKRHDRVHEAHLQRLVRVVLTAHEPDLLRLLGSDQP